MGRKPKNAEQILYFDREDFNVYVDPGKHWFESFVPTHRWVQGERGWLVVVEYSTYDSFGPGDDSRIEIVDAYTNEDVAHEVARAIQVFGRGGDKKVLDIPLGNGVDRLTSKHTMNGKEYDRDMGWTGWGSSPKRVTVHEFVVNEKPKRDNVYEIGYGY